MEHHKAAEMITKPPGFPRMERDAVECRGQEKLVKMCLI